MRRHRKQNSIAILEMLKEQIENEAITPNNRYPNAEDYKADIKKHIPKMLDYVMETISPRLFRKRRDQDRS